MRSLLALLLLAASPVRAQATPAGEPAAPQAGEEAPAVAAGATGGAAGSERIREAPSRFTFGNLLVHAHAGAGIEPHALHCSNVSVICSVVAFGVGGQLLWRGIVGLGLGFYASQGSPIVREGVGSLALGDRISVTAAVAVRPLAYDAWRRGDGWLTRLASGLSLEAGPSVEYVRSSGPTLQNCDIQTTETNAGLHLGSSIEIPLVGAARSGWLSLRVGGRLIVSPTVDLAPMRSGPDAPCRAQVRQPGVASQVLLGIAYSR